MIPDRKCAERAVTKQAMKIFSELGLRAKITLAFSAMFVVCGSVAAISALKLFEEEKKASLASATYTLVSSMADSVDAKLNLLHQAVIAVAAATPARALQPGEYEFSEHFLGQQTALLSMFDNGLFLVNAEGRLIGEFPPRPERRGSDVSAREYFHHTIETRKPYISKPYRSTHQVGEPAVIMTAPVFNAEGELIGLLYASMDLLGKNILADISAMKIGQTGYMFAGVGRESMIAYPYMDRIMKPLASPGQNRLIDLAVDHGYDGTMETVTSAGVPALGSVRHLRSTGWIIGAMLPLEEVYAPIRDARRYFIMAVMVGTMLILVLVWWLVGRVTSPLVDMTNQVEQIAQTASAHNEIRVKVKDEIGVLAGAFNLMLGRLARANDDLEDKIQEIQRLAFSDPLTRLPNRRYLTDRLRQAIAIVGRRKLYGATLFIDLDDFKTINDTLGHDVGDLLLQQTAKRLSSCLREGDTLARFGGDEFVVLLEDLPGNVNEAVADTQIVCEKILSSFDATFMLIDAELRVTPSIGVALFGHDGATVEELFRQADLAMYQSKAAGGNAALFFDPAMQAQMTTQVAMRSDLRNAIVGEQFTLHFQPQVDMAGRFVGAEALIRWQHPQRGLVSPGEFIPVAEQTGLIIPIGTWVLNKACLLLSSWAKREETRQLTMAVNVSALQFQQPDFTLQVQQALSLSGADPHKLKLEITESTLLDSVEEAISKMQTLRSIGISLSLDDFGTGYSSLAYLKRLPLDQLKIDRSFVRDVLNSDSDHSIAKIIVMLAQSLGLGVISEGVETGAQRDVLAALGCHAFQGYLFGKPAPIEEFEEKLVARGIHSGTSMTS